MKDAYGREINYMRISITDRCNLRCRYCMPEGIPLVDMEEILTFEEIETVAKAAIKAGICRFKITGGEPLVRRGCVDLIRDLKKLPGTEQVTLTTNGVLLEQYLEELLDAGLDAVNISLDTLDAVRYKQITGIEALEQVFAGIQKAADAKLKVKINVVPQKDMNEDEWNELAMLAKEYPVDVRFIEMMPIGYGKEFVTISNEELLGRLMDKYDGIKKDLRRHGNGPAVYYKIPGFQGSIGFISAIHGKFCDSCNRIRLTAKGQFKPCLCFGENVDIREILRGGQSQDAREEEVFLAIRDAILKKPKQHCFEEKDQITELHQMAQIGG